MIYPSFIRYRRKTASRKAETDSSQEWCRREDALKRTVGGSPRAPVSGQDRRVAPVRPGERRPTGCVRSVDRNEMHRCASLKGLS